MKKIRLSNGREIPQLGIGTFNFPSDEVTKDAISFALKNGYTHIDTAHAYNVERGIGERNNALFNDETIKEIAKAHSKTPAQVILKWHLQEGYVAIPGATDHNYILENINIFDFELSNKEMNKIRALDGKGRFFKLSYEQTKQFVSGIILDD